MTVWVLVEESEDGSLADGNPYCILSIHATEAGAEAARDEWRAEHDGLSGPHAFDGDPDESAWCAICGSGCDFDAFEVLQ